MLAWLVGLRMLEARKFIRIGAWALAVVFAFPLFLSALYLVQGSLEMFPTEEQQGSVRIAAFVSFIFFATLEAVIVVGLRYSASFGNKLRSEAPKNLR